MAASQGFMNWKGDPISKKRHGGARAAMFVYFMVVMTSMAYVSNTMNVVMYLRGHMHMDIAGASALVTNFIGSTSAFSLMGAFLSDSFITRFNTVIIFGLLEFLGFGLLALQAHYPSLQPPKCKAAGQQSNCERARGHNAALLYIGLYTVAMGEGSLRSALAPFGGDQFDDEDQVEMRQKSSYFNWYTFGISLGAFAGLTIVVWIENNRGWDYGFGLSAIAVLLGTLVIACGSPLYRHLKPSGSPLTRISQVLVAALRKRSLVLPESVEVLWTEQKEGSKDAEVLPHTKDYKFLDRAAIYHGYTGSWSLCTVTQVEETKIILRMLPVFISSIIGYIPIPLLITLTIQQGSTMNTKLKMIQIPPASLFIIPVIFQMIFLVVYDRVFVPLARRLTGYSSGITHLQRVGAGFLSTIVGACVAALVETKRRAVAENCGLLNSASPVPMSVFWLGMQFLIIGIIDVTSFVGLLEFFNAEVSRGMRSVGTAIFWCAIGMASLLGSLLVNVVNRVSRHGDQKGWLDGNNLNESHLDWFYWFLAALGFVAFLNYTYWAQRYVYRQRPSAAASY